MEDRLAFGLSERICADLEGVFARHPEIERVLIFGSRAKGCARPGSDIDLAVFAPQMDDGAFARLWEEIDDLPLVFKVDLLHWDRLTSPRLKSRILEEGQVFWRRG